MRILRSLVVLAFTILASSVGASVLFVPQKQTIKRIPDQAHIYISGEITSGDVQALKIIIDQINKQFGGQPIVLLNSPGGSVPAALEMGRLLRKYLFRTVVDGGSSCSSACVFLLAGGVSRSVFLDGRIGLHRPRLEYQEYGQLSKNQANAAYDKIKRDCVDYMMEMGISNQVFFDMLKISSQNIKFVDREYDEATALVGTDPAWEEWVRAQSIKSQGEAKVKAMDNLMDCYNAGIKQTTCDSLYKREIK
jgi:hypothetical protein